ncbi:MAG: tetratricopeptide repeat protein [Promethearchaeota archaeon]
MISEELLNINRTFNQGLYFKALDVLEDFEQTTDLSPNDKAFSQIIKSKIFYELGRSIEALKFAEEAFNICQEHGYQSFLFDSYIAKALALLNLGDFDKILDLLSEGENLLKQLSEIPRSDYTKKESVLKLIRSMFTFNRDRDINKALEYGEESLRISEEHNNTIEIVLGLEQNSVYYTTLGNLDRAISYMERSLRIQRTYRQRDNWRTLKDLGVLKGIIGELDLALEYTNQSIVIAEELGNKAFIAECLNNSSLIYRQMGNLDYALKDLKRSLTIWEESGNKVRLIACLDSLFIVSLDANFLKQAEHYLLRMQQLNEQILNKISDVACRLNKALLLKMSSNSLEKDKAKEILQNIVREDIINWEFTERALLHLCDIYLFELQTNNNQDILREINPLLSRLSEFAESQHYYRLIAETDLLQGKLALIQMNMGDARHLFTKAERVADEHGLQLLARTISTEHDKLLIQLEQWENLLKNNPTVSERVKLVEIDKTLDHLLGKKLIEPPDLVEEEPILLVIMTKAGSTFFNHTFKKKWDHSDLFSSFISAFNTFSSEIFAKTIDRIKIGENTIFIKPVEPFVTCYVSRGQSYLAKKKLNKFSDTIKNKIEIWDTLIKSTKTFRELDVNNTPLLGVAVNEIFGELSN